MAASNSARQGSNPCAGAKLCKRGRRRSRFGRTNLRDHDRDALTHVIIPVGRRSALPIEEESMKCHWLLVGLGVLALATIDASLADAKQRHRGARNAVRHAPAGLAPTPSFEPARMI